MNIYQKIILIVGAFVFIIVMLIVPEVTGRHNIGVVFTRGISVLVFVVMFYFALSGIDINSTMKKLVLLVLLSVLSVLSLLAFIIGTYFLLEGLIVEHDVWIAYTPLFVLGISGSVTFGVMLVKHIKSF